MQKHKTLFSPKQGIRDFVIFHQAFMRQLKFKLQPGIMIVQYSDPKRNELMSSFDNFRPSHDVFVSSNARRIMEFYKTERELVPFVRKNRA